MDSSLTLDILSIIFLLFACLLILGILSIPFILLYKFYGWLKNKGFQKTAFAVVATFVVYFIYSAYTAVFPTDSFYFSEFERVTLREVPKSGIVLRKDASYPDFHGDYCSASLIELSSSDYKELLKELNTDKRLIRSPNEICTASNEFDQVMGQFKRNDIIASFRRKVIGKEDHHLYIGFLSDRKSIVVGVCVT